MTSIATDDPGGGAGTSDVEITGLGIISCLGRGPDAFWRGMSSAVSAPVPVRDPGAHMDVPLMYLVPEVDVPDGPRWQDGLPLGDASRYAISAARDALAEAGLSDLAAVDPARLGVVLGTGMGDSSLHERWHETGADGDRWAPVFSPAAALGAALGAAGPVTSVSNACAASGYSISLAADLIRSGEADIVITGGSEAYSRVALGCFNRLGAIDPERCRPFDLYRQGTVFGEGAAILVLESAAHARSREAPASYARLTGIGWSCDAHHATAPEPEGVQIARAMRRALDAAGVTGDQLGCVVPHGTGTQLNDVVEGLALHQVMGSAGQLVPLYSLKGLVGHTGGAAGAMAAVTAALILRHGAIPPNVTLGEQDPECKVALPAAETQLEGNCVLVNAYAFGGNNVSLTLTGPRS
ncbi:MAG: beta-ketoacyl-[acyl-carrier-protein] synthase family protein [Nocardiopsaceae bacterium]|nr:beta-ketoacyl-[acyl-carrier-protein] synthase family protein [Nocardiopsaceae bacterium]